MDLIDRVVLVTTGDQGIVKGALALIDTDVIMGDTIRMDGGRHLR